MEPKAVALYILVMTKAKRETPKGDGGNERVLQRQNGGLARLLPVSIRRFLRPWIGDLLLLSQQFSFVYDGNHYRCVGDCPRAPVSGRNIGRLLSMKVVVVDNPKVLGFFLRKYFKIKKVEDMAG